MCQIWSHKSEDFVFDSVIQSMVISSGSNKSKNFARYLQRNYLFSSSIFYKNYYKPLMNAFSIIGQLVPQRVVIVFNVLIIVVFVV